MSHQVGLFVVDQMLVGPMLKFVVEVVCPKQVWFGVELLRTIHQFVVGLAAVRINLQWLVVVVVNQTILLVFVDFHQKVLLFVAELVVGQIILLWQVVE